MILVPNHLQPLSGSRICLYLMLFLFVGCGTSKKTPRNTHTKKKLQSTGNVVYDPNTGRYKIDTILSEKMDTIEWMVSNPDGVLPLDSKDLSNMKMGAGLRKNGYNITVLLPLQGASFQSSPTLKREQEKAIHFLGGLQIASQILSNSQSGFSLNVKDINYKKTASINYSLSGDEDLIIGPLNDRASLSALGQLAKQVKVPFISPVYPTNNALKDNEYHIQVAPSYDVHCKAIIESIVKTMPSAKISVLERNNKKNRTVPIMRAFESIKQRDRLNSQIHKISIDERTEDFHKYEFLPHLDTLRENAIIIPAHSLNDEQYVNSVLRLLTVSNTFDNITVYGMPVWKKYQKVNYEYYRNLNLHISSSQFVDRKNREVKHFEQSFYSKFRTYPLPEAFIAYDILDYFTKRLEEGGTYFYKELEEHPDNGLSTTFRFENIVAPGNIQREKFDIIERIENQYVHMLRFENYKFIALRGTQ